MNQKSQYIEFHSGPPAGLTVRSNLDGATLGMWTGERELIASLNPHQVQWLVSALTQPTSLVQLTGNIKELVFPPNHPFNNTH